MMIKQTIKYFVLPVLLIPLAMVGIYSIFGPHANFELEEIWIPYMLMVCIISMLNGVVLLTTTLFFKHLLHTSLLSLGFAIAFLGFIFKIQHWPGVIFLYATGLVVAIIGIILMIKKTKHNKG